MATHNNNDAVTKILAGVYSFYRADLTSFHTRTWLNALANYSLEQINDAFNQHLSDPESGQFLPKPADIVKQLQGTHGDRALVAWGKVYGAIERVGAWASVQFDDQIIHAVIEDMGGWVKINSTKMDELPFTQKRFCDTYRAYSRRGELKWPPYLPGLTETSNTANGFKQPALTLIGDKEKCAKVGQLGSASQRHQITVAGEVERLLVGMKSEKQTAN